MFTNSRKCTCLHPIIKHPNIGILLYTRPVWMGSSDLMEIFDLYVNFWKAFFYKWGYSTWFNFGRSIFIASVYYDPAHYMLNLNNIPNPGWILYTWGTWYTLNVPECFFRSWNYTWIQVLTCFCLNLFYFVLELLDFAPDEHIKFLCWNLRILL